MKSPRQLFSIEDREKVSQAVVAAESRTSAEIVAVVAGASGRYDRPEDVIGLWTGLVALSVTWALWPAEVSEPGNWNEISPFAQLAALIVAVVLGFIFGAWVGSRVGWLRRLFTPRVQMLEEVWGRARQVFFDRRISRTAGRSGVLLYVSLYERMAAVIADQMALEKLGQEYLDHLCAQLTAQLRTSSPTVAFCSTIASAGERLAEVLPRAADDINELGDALVLLD